VRDRRQRYESRRDVGRQQGDEQNHGRGEGQWPGRPVDTQCDPGEEQGREGEHRAQQRCLGRVRQDERAVDAGA
jgi:hypothetical protein